MVGNSLDRGEAAWAVSKGLFLFFPEKRPELSVGGWTGFWEFDVCSGNTKRAESDPFGPTCIVGPSGIWTFYGPGIFWKHIWRWGRVAGSGGTWKSRASPPPTRMTLPSAAMTGRASWTLILRVWGACWSSYISSFLELAYSASLPHIEPCSFNE